MIMNGHCIDYRWVNSLFWYDLVPLVLYIGNRSIYVINLALLWEDDNLHVYVHILYSLRRGSWLCK